MASMTIHALPELLDARLTEEAQKRKTSKNQLIKDVLAQGLGLQVHGAYSDDYREFCGLWTVAEKNEFEITQRDNTDINQEDWL